MHTFLKWGNFKDLPAWPGKQIDDFSSFLAELGRLPKTPKPVVFVRDNSDAVTLGGALPQLRDCLMVLVYERSDPKSNIAWLSQFPTMNHILPLSAENPLLQISGQTSPPSPQESHWTSFKKVVLTHTDECATVHDQLAECIKDLSCFAGFDEAIQTSASEILTNAFYNARLHPESGLPMVTDRTIKFGLDEGQSITFMFGRENNYFWLVVDDCYGTLDRGVIVSSILRAATERTVRLDKEGGAGLGLMMLYTMATEVNFYLNPGKSTTVSCKFKLAKRNLEFEAEPSALNIYGHQDGRVPRELATT